LTNNNNKLSVRMAIFLFGIIFVAMGGSFALNNEDHKDMATFRDVVHMEKKVDEIKVENKEAHEKIDTELQEILEVVREIERNGR